MAVLEGGPKPAISILHMLLGDNPSPQLRETDFRAKERKGGEMEIDFGKEVGREVRWFVLGEEELG